MYATLDSADKLNLRRCRSRVISRAVCLNSPRYLPDRSDHVDFTSRVRRKDAPFCCHLRSLALNMSSDYKEGGDVAPLHSGIDSPTLTRTAATAFPAAPLAYLSPPDDEPNESDSAYGDDTLLRDDTKTLASYITEYRYEFGRRYHAFRDGAYWVRAGRRNMPALVQGFFQYFFGTWALKLTLWNQCRDQTMRSQMSSKIWRTICIC